MEITAKGESAELGGMKQCMVSMKWTTATDFDLAALYEAKDGTKGMVYFNSLGDLNAMPFMKLSGDEGVGDTGGDNEETMRITKFDDMNHIHIVAWDYGAMTKGQAARFKESDVSVSLMDDSGTNHDVKIDTGDMGNVCVIASIDNTSPMGAKLVNASKVGLLKSFPSSTDEFFTIADQ